MTAILVNLIGEDGNADFKGYIRDFRIYSKVLDINQINDLYNEAIMNKQISKYTVHIPSLEFTANKKSGIYSAILDGSTYYTANMSNINFDAYTRLDLPQSINGLEGITISCTINSIDTSYYKQSILYFTNIEASNSMEIYLEYNVITCSITNNNYVVQKASMDFYPIFYNTFYTITWVIAKGSDRFSSSWYIYINDTLVYSKEFTSIYISSSYSSLTIGSANGKNNMNGFINDFRIYSKPLQNSEILSICSAMPYYPDTQNSSNLINSFKLHTYNNDVTFKDKPLMALNLKDDNYILNKSILFTQSLYNTKINTEISDYNSNHNYYSDLPYFTFYQYMNNSNINDLAKIINHKGFNIHFIFNTKYISYTPILYIGDENASLLYVRIIKGRLYFELVTGSDKYSKYYYIYYQ